VLEYYAGQPLPGHHPDPAAHLLNDDHERTDEPDEPELTVPEDRSCLRVGRDTRRIIVGRAGDEPWTNFPELSSQSLQELHGSIPMILPYL